MKKVFGYPEFNTQGEKVLTTYENEYKDMLMDIRVYKMAKSEIRQFYKPDEEMAILLLSGRMSYKWDNKNCDVSRKDVFTEGPWCLHVCKNVQVTIQVEEDTEVLVQSTYNDKDFPSKLYGPQDAPWVYFCENQFGGTAKRQVNTIFDYHSAPYSNMVIGEVMNDRGNWSGYIPHQHPQPETYYFMFDRPEGFGASFVGDDVYKIKEGSFSAIPGGKTHPQACAPGYKMYTCWMIRHLVGNPWTDRIDDERYTWLLDTTF